MTIYDEDGPVEVNDRDVILGSQTGVWFVPRGKNDTHALIRIITEDDENWFYHGTHFSNFWLPDLIEVLQRAEAELKRRNIPEMHNGQQWGWKLR